MITFLGSDDLDVYDFWPSLVMETLLLESGWILSKWGSDWLLIWECKPPFCWLAACQDCTGPLEWPLIKLYFATSALSGLICCGINTSSSGMI